MIEAYLETIRDFEIELRNTKWWRFKRQIWLSKQIEYYEGLIEKDSR